MEIGGNRLIFIIYFMTCIYHSIRLCFESRFLAVNKRCFVYYISKEITTLAFNSLRLLHLCALPYYIQGCVLQTAFHSCLRLPLHAGWYVNLSDNYRLQAVYENGKI